MVDDDDKRSGRRPFDPRPERPSPLAATNKEQSGGVSAPFSTINISGDLIAGDLIQGVVPDAGAERAWRPSAGLRRYLDWLAAQKHRHFLRGVGAGDLYLTLDQTYVSLNLEVGPKDRLEVGREHHRPSADGRDFPLAALFAQLGEARSKHALLLGDPGSGKSTALRKLGQLVGEQARHACGDEPTVDSEGDDSRLVANTLDLHYVPIFVRLREWREDDKKLSLKDFVCRELRSSVLPAARADVLPPDAADVDEVWAHGHLVLLLDGLDEITSLDRRAEFCASLDSALSVPSNRGLRVVITCRHAGYDEKRIKLVGAAGFGRAALKPLSKEQAELLIKRWFEEVARSEREHLDRDRATRCATRLTRALEDPRLGDYRRAMYATPLIVTLLCVLEFRGKPLPQNRADLYELCLEVLVESWHQAKRVGEAAPASPRPDELELNTHEVIKLLRPIAFDLHSAERADKPESTEQIERDSLLAKLGDGLDEQGLGFKEIEVLEWLHGRAGVLDELAPGSYGFFHLGVQEYLTALHIAFDGKAALCRLAERVVDSWWREVILLAASLRGRGSFAPLMAGLLDRAVLSDDEQWKLLRDCVLEGDFTPAPFVDRFSAEPTQDDGPRLRAILRLVKDQQHPHLMESLRALARREDVDAGVRQDAMQTVAEYDARAAGEHRYHVAVVALDDALPQAMELARLLRDEESLSVWPGETEVPSSLADLDSLALREETAAVVVVIGEGPPWGETAPEQAKAKLKLLLRGPDSVAVFAPGSKGVLGEPPKRLMKTIETRGPWDVGALLDHIRPKPAAASGSFDGPMERMHAPIVEPTTGMRLLWVPGGTFMMGSESDEVADDSRPVHLVKVEPFWIGETPVTNEQYRAFVIDKGHPEPSAWRRRGFNDPQQPVVTVSWTSAEAFCRWLSERSGWSVDLPSEAQWEFAARGRDGRPYPWGEQDPDATRAHFDQGNDGSPAIVGSYPEGAGPFGTLDQAGNVWEWCKDVWDEDAYKKRARVPSVNLELDLLGSRGGQSRSMRGGAWYESSRGALAAAHRGRGWLISDNFYNGFRVVVSRVPVDL